MTTSASSQLFETDSGAVVAFLGPWGSHGVFLHRPDKGWEFFPSGSLGHDSFHQQVYRNHRADPITAADLKARSAPDDQGMFLAPFEEIHQRFRASFTFFMNIRDAIAAINQMQADDVIGRYQS